MKSIRNWVAFVLAVLVCASAFAAEPLATSRDGALSGVWDGVYKYGPEENMAPVYFVLHAKVAGTHLSGTIREPNTFGDDTSTLLIANVDGEIEEESVRFTKTYDGTGGVSHSVEYQGLLDRDGASVHGRWFIGESSGPFEMTLRR